MLNFYDETQQQFKLEQTALQREILRNGLDDGDSGANIGRMTGKAGGEHG